MMPTASLHHVHGPQHELAVPAYPRASTSSRRRRKRNKRRSKNRQRANSSGSEEKYKRSSSRRKNGVLPLPHVVPTLEENEENTPQVLLWHSTWSMRGRSSGSSELDKEEERNTTSSSDIFRQQTVRRQGPDVEDDDEDHGIEPLDVLAPQGPKWFEWEYWKERLSTRCCLPKHRARASSRRREPLIDYRPSYLGRYDDNVHSSYHNTWGVPQQQQHYYVLPWPPPQISPLTDTGMPFAFSSHNHQGKPTPPQCPYPNMSVPPVQVETNNNTATVPLHVEALPICCDFSPIDVIPRTASNPNKAGKRKKHHRKSSSLMGTHYELPEADPIPMEEKNILTPIADAQSVSSLESLQSNNWKTPVQQQVKLVIPDTNTTEGTNLSTNSTLSNRVKGLRRSHSRTSSPRPGSKPPIPRRSSTGTKHKSQITNSTVASTALPPLPSPSMPAPSPATTIPMPTGGRDLARSFSEASANTNGSRHRRGGTVTEFSFASLSMMNPKELSKPPRSSIRSTSLPFEVQIQVHVPPSPEEERPSIRMVDSKDSWGVTPPKSYLQDNEGETPAGYISPLEEEQFTLLTASPSDQTTASPRQRIDSAFSEASLRERLDSTFSEAYAADIDSPQTSPQTSSNPQDSLCGDDSRGDEENADPRAINFEPNSPFAKLKDPPSIPPGESWMWSWVNNNNNNKEISPNHKTPAAPKAVTPTQSPSSTASSIVEKEKPRAKTEYLPKSLAVEQSWRSKYATTASEGIALSGWVAFGLGDTLVKKLTVEGRNLERRDVTHVVLPNGSDKLWLSKLDGTSFDSIDLSGCRVEVHEISRQHGRAIYLKYNSTGETACTLLPVCLLEHYNGDSAAFGDGTLCFPKGEYLPDDQQYTTMHIMFALDALLKAKQSFAY